MKTRALVGIVAAFALFGCSRASQQGTKVGASDTGGTPVTLVGCLVPGSGGTSPNAVGTSGNTGVSGFSLIDVTTTSTPTSNPGTASRASGTPGSTGTAGTPPAGSNPRAPGTAAGSNPAVDTGTPRSYSLVSDKQDELQKYQNSQVEVTGIQIASTDTGAGVPDAGAARAPAGTPASDVQRVRVQTVRQLDKSCR
ncbi:MAG TPA: hypothetical protein VFZ98_08410 [Vicinamibacterales bacterium]